MMNDLVIKNGNVILEDGAVACDVAVKDGKITLPPAGYETQ